ncbi:arylsulfatase [Rhodopirellula sallentina]|uniref:Arylsulfatase A n=1 Tax=Rhodopirellula sallentina SM41 TaxID=1263870 RepID=M5U859_9BACT|nr:arylsulfatase [Rhodopirellula sallentina]EMI57464.1 arylsulfatase A [Rhodopirellula sallentina SM41]
MRQLLTTILLALSFLSCHGVASALEGSRPNIVLVMTDDQGMGDLSCMGNQVVRTPNVDHFREYAVRFTDFQVSPTCAPTRSAIMSGRAPFKNGVTHTILQRERMSLETFTVAEALKTAGYRTGIFGKWHLGDEDDYLPGNRGFDEVLIHGAGGIGQVSLGDFPPNKQNVYFDNVLLHNDEIVQTKGFCTDVFFDAGLAWIDRHRDSKDPFFAYIAPNAPHAPLSAPEAYKQRFLDQGYDAGTAGRYGMIENIDDNFGQLMKRLGEWGLLSNTLVIFMTDNGATHLSGKLHGKKIRHFNANLKGGKNSPYEGGTHVPAFWYWKNVFEGGKDIDQLTAHVDIYPTLCELAGADLPSDSQTLDGRSLLPLLKSPNSDWPDRELFFHCGRWPNGKMSEFQFTKCAVRSERWRFVNNAELYDISNDPGETNDVSANYPEVVSQLRKSYDVWWNSLRPYLVNEGLPRIKPDQQPLAIRYHEQLRERGIPEWAPSDK